jgi:signal transduction histidine kinase
MEQTSKKPDVVLKAMGDLVGAFADRLNNPIASIGAALGIVEKELAAYRQEGELDTELAARGVSLMRDRLSGLHQYVIELASFAKPVDLKRSPLALSELVQSVVSWAESLASWDVEIAVTAEKWLPSVMCDREKIEVALKAILHNAVDATATVAKPVIHVDLTRVPVNGISGIYLRVSDNGPGFPADKVSAAVQPFFSTKEAGTGLGLALAAKYIEAHGGHLRIGKAEVLGGARITLFFPLA